MAASYLGSGRSQTPDILDSLYNLDSTLHTARRLVFADHTVYLGLFIYHVLNGDGASHTRIFRFLQVSQPRRRAIPTMICAG